jgi:hypothetical protein
MGELNLIYLGRIRIRTLDPPSISLEHLYASDDYAGEGRLRVRA